MLLYFSFIAPIIKAHELLQTVSTSEASLAEGVDSVSVVIPVLGEASNGELLNHEVLLLFDFCSFECALLGLAEYYFACDVFGHSLPAEAAQRDFADQHLLLILEELEVLARLPVEVVQVEIVHLASLFCGLFYLLLYHFRVFLVVLLLLLNLLLIGLQSLQDFLGAARTLFGLVFEYVAKAGFHVLVHLDEQAATVRY